uniref:Uncharacterized protein n=1 Tax=Arundo donax TaxID=35708 RepID=A0A0A9CNY7_ARUDO
MLICTRFKCLTHENIPIMLSLMRVLMCPRYLHAF